MTTLTLYEDNMVEPAIREALSATCPDCLGEPWVDVQNGGACPSCGGDANAVLTQALDAIAPDADTPPDIYREQVKMLALKLAMCLKETDAEIAALEAHQAAVAQRIRVRKNRIENTRQWAQLNMEAAGLSKIKNEFVTVYLQESREAIEITDMDAVPNVYKRVTLKVPMTMVPSDLMTFVVGTDVLKTQFLADSMQHSDDGIVCDADGVVVEGVTYRPKGHRRSLVVRS